MSIGNEAVSDFNFQLKWEKPDVEALKEFLVHEKQFNETRVDNAIKKLEKAFTGPVQGRLDSFFGVATTSPSKRKVVCF